MFRVTVLQLGVTCLAQLLELYVHAAPDACPDVGGTGRDVAESLAVHELTTFLLHQSPHLDKHTNTSLNVTGSGNGFVMDL